MKKLLALLLTLAMILSAMMMLTACDDAGSSNSSNKNKNDEDEVSIVGTWTGTYDLSESLGEPEGMEDYWELDSFDVEVSLQFKKNGSFKLTYENEDEMYDVIRDAFENAMLAMMEDRNLTLNQFEAQAGMSLDEYLDSIIEQAKTQNDDAEYSYEFEDDTLTLIREKEDDTVEIEFEVQLKENSLKFKEYTGKSKYEDSAKEFLAMGKLERED